MKKISYLALCVAVVTTLSACNKPVSSEKVSDTSTIQQTSNSEIKDTEKDKNVETNNDITKQTEIVQANNSAPPKSTENKTTQNKPSNSKTTVNQNTKNTSPASTTPTQQAVHPPTGKVIVIDPGHANRSNLEKEPLAPGSSEMKIKDGGGAQGVATGTPEYRVNMNVAVKLRDLLQSKGYTVVMTKTQDSQSLGNVERANIWNNANAALVIRIHADSSTNSSTKGASMLVPSPMNDNTKAIYAASKSYGKTVLNTLVQEVGMPNRGVTEHSDMTGFNWSKVPVILVEMGFLSNPDEDRLLSSQAYEDKLAKALADGVANAVK